MTILAPLLALSLLVAPPPPSDAEPVTLPSVGPVAASLELSELRTPRFKLVHTRRARAAAQLLAKDLEWMRDDVARLLGRDWPGVTEVRMGFGKEEYEALALPGGKPPSWAIALAYPGRNVVLVEAISLNAPDGPATVRHELVHVGLGQFGRNWPRWFQEGLAQQLTGEAKWRVEHIATLTRAVTQDRVFDFDDLTEGFPERPDDVEIAYAQSVAFIEFLRERHGARPFLRLLDRMSEGDHFEKAFGVAFLVPVSMEEAAFKKELPRKYPWWPLLLSTGTLAWVVSSVLVVMAWVRRRRVVRALRAEQLRVETLHEMAKALIGLEPANDDALADELFPFEGTPMPWVVNIVVAVEPPQRADASSATHRSAEG
ncbi:MAG: peptidase MA family metallohydrolase [Myxococcota bacterium]